MYRIIGFIILIFFFSGCMTVKVQKYLEDKAPYQKKFYAAYDKTLATTREALQEMGWRISETANPSVFEQSQATAEDKQILLFTEVRQTPFIFSSRYSHLNVYIKFAGDNTTDVEIRYLAVTPMIFKNSKNYKNNDAVNKIFKRISQLLEQ